jgi:hypothetical protein
MPLPVYIDRHHCYNKEVVSVGTDLIFCYIHDSFFPILFLYLLIAGSILHPHMAVSMFIYYFPGNQTSWNQEMPLNSSNKSNAATMKY